MTQYEIEYKNLHGDQITLQVDQHEESGLLLNDNGEWTRIIQTPPGTAKVMHIIGTATGTTTAVDYTYDKELTHYDRQQIMGAPGKIMMTSTQFEGTEIQFGQIEPLFVPSIGAALVLLGEETESPNEGLRYPAELLGFINSVKTVL